MTTTSRTTLAFAALPLLLAACASTSEAPCPIGGLTAVDNLIQPGEKHFARLWQITRGGENAEGYWSFAGDRLALQRRAPAEGIDCDRIFVTDGKGALTPVSNGKGVCTCSYFMPGDREVLFASTQGGMSDCPPKLDYSQGYVWMLWPEFELYVRDLATGQERALTNTPGYDAEATVSPKGDRIVFTSLRSGDPELWTMKLDGSELRQVTHNTGYDGGAFFSHDGRRLVFRSTIFDSEGDGTLEVYKKLIGENKIRPHRLELMVCDADGSNRRQITELGGANFAPFFYPDDRRVVFSTNHADPQGRNFDLYAVDVDGSRLEAITTYEGFDCFPMFSPDGRWFVFASNRGGTEQGETNLFLAEWK